MKRASSERSPTDFAHADLAYDSNDCTYDPDDLAYDSDDCTYDPDDRSHHAAARGSHPDERGVPFSLRSPDGR